MVRNRGGLLASTGVTALGFARFASFGRAPEGEAGAGGGGGGGGGGAGGAGEEEDYFSDVGGGNGGGEQQQQQQGGEQQQQQGGEPPALPEWAKSFSGEKKGDELSHQEWLAKTGVKSIDDLAQIARDNQKALRESGRVKVPGDGASEAEITAFRDAIGAPKEATGYEVGLPEGADGFELDASVLDPMREIALKYHIPTAAFKEMGEALLKGQLAGFQGELATHTAEKDATLREWGQAGQREQGMAEFKRGVTFLGLKVGDIQRIQTGYGVKATMELMRSIGQRAGEDFFGGNGPSARQQFGYSDLASAQGALDAMISDKETAKKIQAKDPVTVQRYNTLTSAVAAFRQQASAKR
jgi:hypothetical protein